MKASESLAIQFDVWSEAWNRIGPMKGNRCPLHGELFYPPHGVPIDAGHTLDDHYWTAIACFPPSTPSAIPDFFARGLEAMQSMLRALRSAEDALAPLQLKLDRAETNAKEMKARAQRAEGVVASMVAAARMIVAADGGAS